LGFPAAATSDPTSWALDDRVERDEISQAASRELAAVLVPRVV
jgi:hypothetical protein